MQWRKNPFGLSETDYKKIYNSWWNMKNRCSNPKSQRFYSYGERGITLCEEWMDSQVFIGWAVKNGWRPGLTIERIDVNKGYSISRSKEHGKDTTCLGIEMSKPFSMKGI